MDCLTCREALSARTDGETEPVPAEQTDEHLRTCAGCQTWQLRTGTLVRALRVRAAVDAPDLSAQIMANATVPTPTPGWGARLALACVAAGQIALGLSQLLGAAVISAHGGHEVPEGGTLGSHLFNESTAWNIALGLGLFWAVFRPRAATGLLPVLSGFVVILAGMSVHDLITGAAPVPRVASHGLLVLGLCLLFVVNRQHRDAPDGAKAEAQPHTATRTTSPDEPTRPDESQDRPHLRPASRHNAA